MTISIFAFKDIKILKTKIIERYCSYIPIFKTINTKYRSLWITQKMETR